MPALIARVQAEKPPKGAFCVEDVSVSEVDYRGQYAVAALLLEEPTDASAKALLARLHIGEQLRAGCTILRVNEGVPDAQLELSVSLRCQHGTGRSGAHQQRSGLGADQSAGADGGAEPEAGPSTSNCAHDAEARSTRSGCPGAACARVTRSTSELAKRGGSVKVGCLYHVRAKQWRDKPNVLHLQLVHAEHVAVDGSDGAPASPERCVLQRCSRRTCTGPEGASPVGGCARSYAAVPALLRGRASVLTCNAESD